MFYELEVLRCGENPLTALDVSKNTNLQKLSCYSNQLTELDVSKNTALRYLECDDNRLTELNVSKNVSLQELGCSDNQLTELDVSKNTALGHLDCYNNQLTTLDLSKNTALSFLNCYNNRLTTLDLTHNTALRYLYCYDNRLLALDLTKATPLKTLGCHNNPLSAIDLSNNAMLSLLTCSYPISSDDLNYTFNISDFLKAYQFPAGYVLSADIRCNYTKGFHSLTLDDDSMNSFVSIPVSQDNTLRSIRLSLKYSDYSDIIVAVYPAVDPSLWTDDTDSSSTIHSPIITTTDLPDGSEGSAYSATLSALGSTPITWTLVSGDFPTGLALSSSGTLSGTVSTPGAYTFTVQASNSVGSATKLFSIVVPSSKVRPPKITTTSLTDWFTDSPYVFRLAATGTTPIKWTLSGDSALPDGLTLTERGCIYGTVSQEGSYSFTVQASNSQGSDSADFTLKVSAPASSTPPSITTQTADPAATKTSYVCQLMATGTPPFTWTLKGKLPAGLSMNSSCLITGTPTKAGKKSFTVTASNDYGTDKKKITLTVYDMPAIKTTSLKEATAAKKYSASIKGSGTKPLTWELEGSLPQGLSFDSDKAKISGTPTVNDKGMIRVTLSNPAGELSKVYTLTVKAITPTIKPSSLKAGTFGKSYSVPIKLKGTAPITLTLSGDLPEGLSFDNGKITGTPQEVCTNRPLTIFAVNVGGVTEKKYSLTIKAVAPKITTKKLPDAVQGSAYSVSLEATGTPAITWSATGLPSGLSMTTNGNISGTPSKSGKFKVKVSATNSAKTVNKNYTLMVTAASTTKTGVREAEETAQKLSVMDYEARDTVRTLQGVYVPGDGVMTDEYVIVAELGTVSVDEAGMYDFTVKLSDDVPVGKELVYLAWSTEPSGDDVIAEFSDSSGEETSSVPDDKIITLSVWLKPDRTYTPVLAVKR